MRAARKKRQRWLTAGMCGRCRCRGCRGGIVVGRLLHVKDGADGASYGSLGKIGGELDGQLLGFRLPQQSPHQRDDLIIDHKEPQKFKHERAIDEDEDDEDEEF